MEFRNYMEILDQSVLARYRLMELRDNGIIERDDFVESCDRFHQTWDVVDAYMTAHGIV